MVLMHSIRHTASTLLPKQRRTEYDGEVRYRHVIYFRILSYPAKQYPVELSKSGLAAAKSLTGVNDRRST